MNNKNKHYRVRRPKQHEELIKLLASKDEGVFDSLKSVLVFSAAVGYKAKNRQAFSETSEPIPIHYFSEGRDIPFIYTLAIAEFKNVDFLREENFKETITVFEEYAAGGLTVLSDEITSFNIKETIEGMLSEAKPTKLIDDIASYW